MAKKRKCKVCGEDLTAKALTGNKVRLPPHTQFTATTFMGPPEKRRTITVGFALCPPCTRDRLTLELLRELILENTA